jgi:hypothetical protein
MYPPQTLTILAAQGAALLAALRVVTSISLIFIFLSGFGLDAEGGNGADGGLEDRRSRKVLANVSMGGTSGGNVSDKRLGLFAAGDFKRGESVPGAAQFAANVGERQEGLKGFDVAGGCFHCRDPVLVWRPRYILGFMGDTLSQPARIVQVKK